MSETARPALPPMQRIPFATESAETDSLSESLEQLINYYIEAGPDQGRSPVILKSTPGLTAIYTLGTGPVYAMNTDLPGRFYVVSGTHLFRVTDSDIIDMGDVGSVSYTPPPAITIATGPVQMVVCVPPNAYAAGVGETVFHQITGTPDTPFPGASSVAYIDGYFVFTAAGNSSQFFCTSLFDPSTIDALDFAFADAVPNVIRRVITHLGRLWFLGEAGIEIWYDSGDVDFPFRRDAGGIIPYGVLSPRGACICDGSIFWLGVNGIIFRTSGYTAKRVSTHAIEDRIKTYFDSYGEPGSYVSCAVSWVEDGHTFYALTLQKPSVAGMTLVYDCATGRWADRSTSTNGLGRWRVNATALSGIPLFGDAYSGAIYRIDETNQTEGGSAVAHTAVFPPLWNGSRRAFMGRLEIECDLGGAPIVVSWTDDAGATWSAGRSLQMTGKRAVTTRLGSFRERTFKLTTTGRSRILGVDAQIASGDA